MTALTSTARETKPLDMPKAELRALRSDVRDYYEDYGQHLDDGDLEAWVKYFTEDCHYRVISRENHKLGLPIGLIYCMNKNMVRDRVTALRETTVAQPRVIRHFISGVRINSIAENGDISAQGNFLISECLADGEPEITAAGQYQDVLVRDGDGFLFKYRDCIVDNYRIKTSIIIPL